MILLDQQNTPTMWFKRLNKHLVIQSRPHFSQMDHVHNVAESCLDYFLNISWKCIYCTELQKQSLHQMSGQICNPVDFFWDQICINYWAGFNYFNLTKFLHGCMCFDNISELWLLFWLNKKKLKPSVEGVKKVLCL